MKFLIVEAGDRIVVDRHLSVTVSRIQGDKAYLEFRALGGKSIHHLKITPAAPGGPNGQPKPERGERTAHQPQGRRHQRNGQNNRRQRKQPVNPYGMGKPRGNGRNRTGNRATDNERK